MSNSDNKSKIDLFEQLDEALEERLGTDRRKQNLGADEEGQDRRKGDRREQAGSTEQ